MHEAVKYIGQTQLHTIHMCKYIINILLFVQL